jgi:hypothetical protein
MNIVLLFLSSFCSNFLGFFHIFIGFIDISDDYGFMNYSVHEILIHSRHLYVCSYIDIIVTMLEKSFYVFCVYGVSNIFSKGLKIIINKFFAQSNKMVIDLIREFLPLTSSNVSIHSYP